LNPGVPGDSAGPLDADLSLASANIEVRRLSQQLLFAQANERSRIARELHDDVQQILVGLRMSMESVSRGQTAMTPGNEVKDWVGLVQKAIDHVHALTVILHQPGIGNRGLASELRAHISRLALAEGQTVELELDLGAEPLAPEIELACFRIVQEGLANAVKHSKASHLLVRLKQSGHDLSVSVEDSTFRSPVHMPLKREASAC
jgi:signal transduction histidine kinase